MRTKDVRKDLWRFKTTNTEAYKITNTKKTLNHCNYFKTYRTILEPNSQITKTNFTTTKLHTN